MTLLPLPVEAVKAGLGSFLGALRDVVLELLEPSQPRRTFACAQADLPPAAEYPNCQVINTTTRKLVLSTWNGSAWQWSNADGSPL